MKNKHSKKVVALKVIGSSLLLTAYSFFVACGLRIESDIVGTAITAVLLIFGVIVLFNSFWSF